MINIWGLTFIALCFVLFIGALCIGSDR